MKSCQKNEKHSNDKQYPLTFIKAARVSYCLFYWMYTMINIPKNVVYIDINCGDNGGNNNQTQGPDEDCFFDP
jgi:hypothetical protein